MIILKIEDGPNAKRMTKIGIFIGALSGQLGIFSIQKQV